MSYLNMGLFNLNLTHLVSPPSHSEYEVKGNTIIIVIIPSYQVYVVFAVELLEQSRPKPVSYVQDFIPPTDLTPPAHLSTHLRKISDVDGVKNTTCPFSYA